MSYSVKISGEVFSLSQICASGCVLKLKSLACDELAIISPLPQLAALNQEIELFSGSVRKFRGRCSDISAKISGSKSSYVYTFKNAWLDLRELPYLQKWLCVSHSDSAYNPVNVFKARNLFGLDYDGAKLDSASHIAEIIDYAQSKGASLELGSCEATAQFPAYEARDLTCEQALLRILKWSPDVISYFDYAQDTPVLNLKKRSSLPEKSLEGLKLKSLQYAPCRDLQVGSVNIIYERTHTIDGESYSSYETDFYPASAQSDAKNCLSFTVELSGRRANTLVQKIETENIATNSEDWWKSKAPFLKEFEGCDISIDSIKRVSSLPRELVSGTVMEWMLKSVERDIITADISVSKEGSKILTKKVCIKLVATNASSQTYTSVSVSQQSEPTPVGVAKSLYEAMCDLQYKGSLSLIDESGESFAASKIALPGKFGNAAVCESSLNILSKNLTLKFGPQKYLQGDEFAELFRIPKLQNSASSIVRNSAKEIKDAPIELSPGNNQTDTQSFDSEINFLDLIHPGENSTEIVLDPKLIELENLTMQPRKYAVVHNGQLAYAYILSTETFEEEQS